MLVFLVIPLLVILNVKFHTQLPVANLPKLLLVNNFIFALFVASRFLWHLSRVGKVFRYGAGHCRPRNFVALRTSPAETRRVLDKAGYVFTADGTYGEKKDFGYLGTTVFYLGLLILLSVGTWDNLRQFTGILLDGQGPATKLSRLQSYKRVNKGLLAASPASLPQLSITRQIFPDGSLPKGATEIVLVSEDGKSQNKLLIPGVPVSYGDYDISMAKLVFEPEIVIKSRDSKVLFDALVKLDPLVQKRGVFSFYGLFNGVDLGGGVYYQPEKSTLMVVISRGDRKTVADMTFQVDQQVVQGDYILSCAKMGQWSEIHVVRRRHKGLLVFGGALALIGLMLRIAIRPQRIWLEDAPEGCRAWAVGKDTMKRLKAED